MNPHPHNHHNQLQILGICDFLAKKTMFWCFHQNFFKNLSFHCSVFWLMKNISFYKWNIQKLHNWMFFVEKPPLLFFRMHARFSTLLSSIFTHIVSRITSCSGAWIRAGNRAWSITSNRADLTCSTCSTCSTSTTSTTSTTTAFY